MKPASVELLAKCVLRPSVWTAETGAAARWLPSDSPADVVALMVEDVKAGRSQVVDLIRDGEKVGWCVFQLTPAHELIAQAAFGRHENQNLMAEFLPALDGFARACECSTVRIHTMRPGMIVKAQAAGFHVSEVILRKKVARA